MNKQYTRIKGLSDTRRLPRLGKIRKGIKTKNSKGKEYPKEVKYWACPPEVQAVYGAEPTEIDVMLPLDDATVVFPQSYKLYGSNQKLKCKGDGESATRWTKEGGEEVGCPCEELESKQCKQRAHLMVILPKVSMGGCYQIDTGGINDIIAINSYIEDNGYLRGLFGRIAMIPFKLRRIEVKRDDGTGKMIKHWDIQPFFEGNIDVVNSLKGDSQKVLETAGSLQLEAPKEEGAESDTTVVESETPKEDLPWEWEPQTSKAKMNTVRAIYGYFKWTSEQIKEHMSETYKVGSSKDLSADEIDMWLVEARNWAKKEVLKPDVMDEDINDKFGDGIPF